MRIVVGMEELVVLLILAESRDKSRRHGMAVSSTGMEKDEYMKHDYDLQ